MIIPLRADAALRWDFFDFKKSILFLQNKKCKYFQRRISVNFEEN